MKLTSLLFFLGLMSCKSQDSYLQAKALTDSANVIFKNTLDPLKALPLLNQATVIDSNYLPALVTKFNFDMNSGLFDQALQTGKRLIRIKPEVSEYYTGIGLIYEKKNDTVSSKKYFLDAVSCCDSKLENLAKTHKDYNWILLGKASNLIFAGEQISGNDILKKLYDSNSDESFKELVISFMNKPKQQILEEMK
jgi:tetratricopeptide (TPR) repeat protein